MSAVEEQMLNLIGGEFVGAASDATLDVIEPATGAVLASVPAGETEDADRAVAAARVALHDWSTTTPAERAERLLALAAVIEQHADELAAMESRNVGKPLAAAAEELPMIVDTFRFFAGAARCLEGRAAGEYLSGYTSFVRREPIGITVGIAPWNYPLLMAAWKIAPALAAGNVTVLKVVAEMPHGSFKQSGYGKDLSVYGLEDYTHIKHVMAKVA